MSNVERTERRGAFFVAVLALSESLALTGAYGLLTGVPPYGLRILVAGVVGALGANVYVSVRASATHGKRPIEMKLSGWCQAIGGALYPYRNRLGLAWILAAALVFFTELYVAGLKGIVDYKTPVLARLPEYYLFSHGRITEVSRGVYVFTGVLQCIFAIWLVSGLNAAALLIVSSPGDAQSASNARQRSPLAS